jgi:hypothetical protein
MIPAPGWKVSISFQPQTAPGVKIIKLFLPLMVSQNKLECLCMAIVLIKPGTAFTEASCFHVKRLGAISSQRS